MNSMPKRYYAFFTLPTVLAFLISFLIPFLLGLYLSFTKFTTVTDSHWVGISNYVRAFTADATFLNATIFTAKFAVVSVITINILAFSLAFVLTRHLKGTHLFRTVFFMPNLIGGIILGYIWQLLINGVLINFGVDITYSGNYGFWGLVVLMNWQMAGYMMLIYIAAIQGISHELIEAARIDGAGGWQVLRNITIPLCMPAFTICTFLTVSNSFKLFDQNLALTAGAPGRDSAMMALDIFYTFYGGTNTEGIGQAKAVMFFILVGLLVLVQLRLTQTREVEN